MAVFLDTGFLIALKNADDENYEVAVAEMKSLLRGQRGSLFTSDYVIDEVLTLAQRKLRSQQKVSEIADYMLYSPRISLIPLSTSDFDQALENFWKYFDRGLSFTDCTILAQCKSLEIENVASFDKRHFEGVIGMVPE